MEANRKEIIEWLQSPEGEACGSEIYMPGMFGVRPG